MKPTYRYSFLLLFFALLSAPVVAQTTQPCIDSNRINPWFMCGSTSDYNPVCGCDGKTYVNNCASYNRAGINYVQYNGVCSNDIYHFDFWPNPVGDRIQFYMQFAEEKGTQAIVQIFDSYGNLTYYKLLNNVPDEFPYVETIFFGGLRTGVYTLVINAGGVYKYQRFIKYSY